MPAIEHRFDEAPPVRLYLDTDFVIAHLVSSEPLHDRTQRFLTHVATYNRTTMYISSLSWMEFGHVVSTSRFRATLPDDLQHRLNLRRWDRSAEVRRSYLRYFFGAARQLLDQFGWREIGLTPALGAQAQELFIRYNIGA